MAQLVMLFECSDGFTYSCESVLPCVHESPETAAAEFKLLYLQAKESNDTLNDTIKFAGAEHFTSDFEENGQFQPPEFITVAEWFERSGL